MRGPLTLLLPLAALTTYPLFKAMIDSAIGRPPSVFWLLFGTVAAVAVFGALLWAANALNWFNRAQRAREQLISSFSFPQHDVPVTCLWSASDEVYTFFQLMDVATDLPYTLLNPIIILILFVIYFISAILFNSVSHTWYNDIPLIGQFMNDAMRTSVLIAGFYSSILWIILYTIILQTTSMFLAVVFSLFSGIPILTAIDAHYVRLSFALTPPNSGRAEFTDFDISSGFLKHSAAYEDINIAKRVLGLIKSDSCGAREQKTDQKKDSRDKDQRLP
jgi:hypothetical protein